MRVWGSVGRVVRGGDVFFLSVLSYMRFGLSDWTEMDGRCARKIFIGCFVFWWEGLASVSLRFESGCLGFCSALLYSAE